MSGSGAARALKVLVALMSTLLVLGMVLLIYGLLRKGVNGEAAKNPVPVSPPVAFGDQALPLPPGCAVVEMRPDGDRIYLRLGPDGGPGGGPGGDCARIIVVDTASGRLLGTLMPGAAP